MLPAKQSAQTLLELVGLVYEGVLEAIPWTDLLEHLRQCLQANYVSLAIRSPRVGDPGLVIFAGPARPTLALNYERALYSLDPFVDLPADQVLMLHERVDEQQWLQAPIYTDFLRDMQIRHVMGADLYPVAGQQSRLRVTRSAQMPRFAERERELCRFLLPHLSRALRLHARLDRMESARRLYEATLERLGVATLLLDAKGGVVQCSALAARLLAAEHGLKLQGDQLLATGVQDNRRLWRSIRKILDARVQGAEPLVEALSLHGLEQSWGILLRGVPLHQVHAGGAALEVIIRDPLDRPELSEVLLRQLFQLTPAEAALAARLCNGQSVEQAALGLAISRHTARAHLRTIFSKTGISRQADLVQLLLGSVASFSGIGH